VFTNPFILLESNLKKFKSTKPQVAQDLRPKRFLGPGTILSMLEFPTPVCRGPYKTGGVCYIESLKRPPVPRKEIYEWDVGRQYSRTRA
jgi:hypothetical protein